MGFVQDITGCLAETIGKAGVAPDDFQSALSKAAGAIKTLQARHGDGTLPLLHLPHKQDDLDACEDAARLLTNGAGDVAILGTGGSSLGGQALARLAGYSLPAQPPVSGPAGPLRIHFFDNLDAGVLELALRHLPMKTTRFLVISKSGGTPETLLQMLCALEALKKAGLEWNAAAHMIVLSEPGTAEQNPMRALAAKYKLSVLDHDPAIGGRYSVLSNTGLLPAMLFGLDARALRTGAADVLAPLLAADAAPETIPAAAGAALNVALMRRHNISATVLMAYSDRLRGFTGWFQQLWAESLGKNGQGTMPVAATGPMDQHSLMQLFLGGPDDKLYTLIMVNTAGQGPCVPAGLRNDPQMGYLAGRSAGDLTDCQQRATAATFTANRRPLRTITLDTIDETSLGGLFMHFMLETIITGLILGVDPFDQPAVEQSKILTRQFLQTM